MAKRTRSYEDGLHQRLRDPDYAARFLNGVLMDKAPYTKERFLLALSDVAKAYGMSKLAKKTDLARESIYRALSKNGNPQIDTLTAVLDGLGFGIQIYPKKKAS